MWLKPSELRRHILRPSVHFSIVCFGVHHSGFSTWVFSNGERNALVLVHVGWEDHRVCLNTFTADEALELFRWDVSLMNGSGLDNDYDLIICKRSHATPWIMCPYLILVPLCYIFFLSF